MQVGKTTACKPEFGNCRPSIVMTFCCKNLLTLKALEWPLCKCPSRQAELLGFTSLASLLVWKMVEYAEIFNLLQLNSCIYISICVFIFLPFISFFLHILCKTCDTDPEPDHHLGQNKHGFIDFKWAKESYIRWGSVGFFV